MMGVVRMLMIFRHRATSIKTRIETLKAIGAVRGIEVTEQLPLKQGLKPFRFHRCTWIQCVTEQLPLKQGLKHIDADVTDPTSGVTEQLPLKQGLKLIDKSSGKRTLIVSQSNFH